MALKGAVAAFGLVLAGWPLGAVGQTVITPDVGASRGLGTTVAQVGTVFSVDGGARAGNNLFHSFSQFDLAAGNTARWVRGAGDGGAIANVVNRVTGGQASTLAGVIDSTALPNAAFYFINPAGIVFGAGAVVNVPGAAHFSTAADLRFADGARFAVATPNGSTLSIAAPESFGFVGGQGAIAMDHVGVGFAPGSASTALSFSASNIAISNSQFLAGGVDLTAVGDHAAVVRLADPLATLGAGQVLVDSSAIGVRAGAAPGSPLRIGGGKLVISLSGLFSESLGGVRGGDIQLSAPVIDLGGSNVITAAVGDAQAGDVHVHGDAIVISGGSLGSFPGGERASGSLFITARQSLATEGAILGVSTFSDVSDAAAGTISIRSPELIMHKTSLATQASGRGAPGRVLIDAGDVVLDEVFYLGDAEDGVGEGLFRLRATGDILMRDVFLSSNANGAANGGVIDIQGRDIELTNSLVLSEAFTASTGAAGRVMVTATGDLHLRNSLISSSTDGDGDAGDLRIQARAITLDLQSGFRSDAFLHSSGDAGAVSVSARTLLLQDRSEISSASQDGATGDAGAVLVDVDRLNLETGGSISSTTNGPGTGGAVTIHADEILLAGESQGFTSIRAETNGDGRGGSVMIEAAKLVLDRGALISTVSLSTADAGDIRLDVGELLVLNGSIVATAALGAAGKSGAVDISAEKLEVRSDARFDPSYITSAGKRGGGGDIRLDVASLHVEYGQISSDTTIEGDAGDISIDADAITLRTFGAISSSTQGFGDAGSIGIQAKSLLMEKGTSITSAATGLSVGGDAGSVTVAANDIILGDDANITTSTLSSGDAGQVAIKAKSLRLDGGFISSSAEIGATGRARDVQITADHLAVVNRGSIDTLSANPNPAGTVDIRAGTLLVDGLGSVISSENLAGDPVFTAPGPGGNAGTIQIAADNVTISNGGRISTNSFAGAAGDIDVAIRRPGLFILEGRELPGFIQTSSGPGTGGKITISDPLAIISNGGLILALGQQRGAKVQIESRYFVESADRRNVVSVDGEFQIQTGLYDVSSGTVSRDLSVLDASRVLRGQCPAARSTGAVSQLITRPVGPYAPEPAIDVLRTSPPRDCS